ncbi:hypothetical protein AB0D38_07225 [Streptomyces sp. NPDC048279]|uniref:hypothetical protein n=1 Tax=Streptomyces sp. NPDC048279 TaxID=3154714 RepID=UPI003440C933
MRIRTTAAVTAACGAAALTLVAVPAATATAADAPASVRPWQLTGTSAGGTGGRTAFTATTATTATAKQPYALAVNFSKVKVAGGKTTVSVGMDAIVHVSYSFNLTATNVDVSAPDFYVGLDLYRGSASKPTSDLYGDQAATCDVTSSESSYEKVVTGMSCKGKVDIYPRSDLRNADAGAKWHAVAWAVAYNGQKPQNPADVSKIGTAELAGQTSPTVRRLSRLTVNAAPEPVRKGKTLTVTGALTRANWETHKYAGYTGQKVKLQFRKKGTSTYKTLKTITTDSHGNLRTTCKATTDGYWRYSFAGTATTPAVSATGDYVDVK